MLVARQWLHSYSMVKMDQQLLNTNCDPLHLPLTLSEPDGILWLECDEFNSADLLNNKDSIRQCQQHCGPNGQQINSDNSEYVSTANAVMENNKLLMGCEAQLAEQLYKQDDL